MGSTKRPVSDDGFYLRMINACADREERGMVQILDLTGMNVSSLCSLSPKDLVREGDGHALYWMNPRTSKSYSIPIPDDQYQMIFDFVNMRRKTRQQYHALVKKIGRKAGYQDISPITFRHNLCLRLLKEKCSFSEVQRITGCSLPFVMRTYIKLQDNMIAKENDESHARSGKGYLSRFSSRKYN